jgi:hypothetical protein
MPRTGFTVRFLLCSFSWLGGRRRAISDAGYVLGGWTAKDSRWPLGLGHNVIVADHEVSLPRSFNSRLRPPAKNWKSTSFPNVHTCTEPHFDFSLSFISTDYLTLFLNKRSSCLTHSGYLGVTTTLPPGIGIGCVRKRRHEALCL